jgi:TrmH family RNA methyltransferase
MKQMIAKAEVKYIQSLAHKKFREAEKLFIVEGVKMLEELLAEKSAAIKKIFAIDAWSRQHASSLPPSIELQVLEDFELDKISSLQSPNEVLALVHIPQPPISGFVPKGITVVLDQVQDPGNLGTIIRSCDWFGVENIVCSMDTADAYNPKVVQAAKGSLLRPNIFYSSLEEFLSLLPKMPAYAAVLDGESIGQVSFETPCLLLIGNESNGLSSAIRAFATKAITIPRKGKAESLNAGVAAAVILSAMTN